jgi:hypothetical protein
MKLPEIRARLEELADEHNLPELRTLASETRRRYHGRKAPPVSKPITPSLEHGIRTYAQAFPDMAMHEIARVFGTNQGRVSEILFGKRT